MIMIMQRYRPVVYAVGDELPLATLSGGKRPDGSVVGKGERTYVNRCTTKVHIYADLSLSWGAHGVWHHEN